MSLEDTAVGDAAKTDCSAVASPASQGTQDQPRGECLHHAVGASAAENAAIELDREHRVQEAIAKYENAAVLLCLAVDRALPDHPADKPRLEKHLLEVRERIAYLRGLADGAAATVPVETHIKAVQLDMCVVGSTDCTKEGAEVSSVGGTSDASGSGSSLATYVALGVAGAAAVSSGGFLVLGSVMCAGATAAAGVAGAGLVVRNPEKVDTAAQKAGDLASNLQKDLTDSLGDAPASSAVKGLGAKIEEARMSAVVAGAALAERATNHENTAEISRRMATGLQDASKEVERVAQAATQTASESAEKAKKLREGFSSFLADASSKAETALKGSGGYSSWTRLLARSEALGESPAAGATSSSQAESAEKDASPAIKSERTPAAEDTASSVAAAAVTAATPAAPLDLRVDVLEAFDLSNAEYRLFDHSASLVRGGSSLTEVYVELQVGARKVTTLPVKANGGNSVSFAAERHLLPVTSDDVIMVTVRDKRGLQALLRGDPLIGEGRLSPGPEAVDGKLRSHEVQLLRSEKPVGKVSLRYCTLRCEPEDSASTAATTTSAAAAAATSTPAALPPAALMAAHDRTPSVPETDERQPDGVARRLSDVDATTRDFYTPPSSPR
eukprot:TRINITY_DN73450_c0_g1_i1.p1 TRINITY_DN73450_c0_g1~~TRINITY_DN73450_c0_g1_i1.p1  ORF type:complete len:616 (-),score=96.06 TRINITY_DN73450_c0_g1_i1:43-1890(-)